MTGPCVLDCGYIAQVKPCRRRCLGSSVHDMFQSRYDQAEAASQACAGDRNPHLPAQSPADNAAEPGEQKHGKTLSKNQCRVRFDQPYRSNRKHQRRSVGGQKHCLAMPPDIARVGPCRGLARWQRPFADLGIGFGQCHGKDRSEEDQRLAPGSSNGGRIAMSRAMTVIEP